MKLIKYIKKIRCFFRGYHVLDARKKITGMEIIPCSTCGIWWDTMKEVYTNNK